MIVKGQISYSGAETTSLSTLWEETRGMPEEARGNRAVVRSLSAGAING